MELWSTLKFNANMEISSFGRLRNRKTGTVWKLLLGRGGYPQISIYSTITKSESSYKIHRLVADAFLPKIEGKHHVNHKDFNKQNNNVSNLEWCTLQENVDHYRKYAFIPKLTADQVLYIRQNIESIGVSKLSKELKIKEGYVMNVANGTFFKSIHTQFIRDKKHSFPKAVKQYDKSGNFIKEYTSIRNCEKETGCKLSKIQMVLSGERSSYKGFVFASEGYKQKKRKQNRAAIKYISLDTRGHKILKRAMDGGIIESFNSMKDASKSVGCSTTNIHRVLRGEQKTAGGYKWSLETIAGAS